MEGIINWENGTETRLARVTVDGIRYGRVTVCSPGPGGWIEKLVTDKEGNYVIDPDTGDIRRRRIVGFVRVEFNY